MNEAQVFQEGADWIPDVIAGDGASVQAKPIAEVFARSIRFVKMADDAVAVVVVPEGLQEKNEPRIPALSW